MKSEERIDKWIWAMRLFKTRTVAAEACKKGRVSAGGRTLKPSATIKVGDVVSVSRPPAVFSFRVLQLSENRLGAKMVPLYMENVTPAEQYELIEMAKASRFGMRDRGAGRPTKKERRELDEFYDISFGFEDEIE